MAESKAGRPASSTFLLAPFDREAGPGKILLLHDGSIGQPQSREARTRVLASILEKYRTQDYEFVTISELLKIGGLQGLSSSNRT